MITLDSLIWGCAFFYLAINFIVSVGMVCVVGDTKDNKIASMATGFVVYAIISSFVAGGLLTVINHKETIMKAAGIQEITAYHMPNRPPFTLDPLPENPK